MVLVVVCTEASRCVQTKQTPTNTHLVDDEALDPGAAVLAVENHHLLHPAGPPARSEPSSIPKVLSIDRLID